MLKVRALLASFTLLLMVSALARANTVVYNNGGPNQKDGNEATGWVQTEDFMLQANATIDSIEFWSLEDPNAPGYLGSVTWWIVGDDGHGNPDFNNIIDAENPALSVHNLTANGCT